MLFRSTKASTTATTSTELPLSPTSQRGGRNQTRFLTSAMSSTTTPSHIQNNSAMSGNRRFVRIHSTESTAAPINQQPVSPRKQTFETLSKRGHSGEWLFNVEGWKRFFHIEPSHGAPQEQYYTYPVPNGRSYRT